MLRLQHGDADFDEIGGHDTEGFLLGAAGADEVLELPSSLRDRFDEGEGGDVEGPAAVTGSGLRPSAACAVVAAGLIEGGVHAEPGDGLVEGVEALGVAQFADEGGDGFGAHAWDGAEDVGGNVLKEALQTESKRFDDVVEGMDHVGEAFKGEGESFGAFGDVEDMSRGGFQTLGEDKALFAAGSVGEDFGHVLGIGLGELSGMDPFAAHEGEAALGEGVGEGLVPDGVDLEEEGVDSILESGLDVDEEGVESGQFAEAHVGLVGEVGRRAFVLFVEACDEGGVDGVCFGFAHARGTVGVSLFGADDVDERSVGSKPTGEGPPEDVGGFDDEDGLDFEGPCAAGGGIEEFLGIRGGEGGQEEFFEYNVLVRMENGNPADVMAGVDADGKHTFGWFFEM